MEEINLKELFDYFKERIMLFIIIVLSVLVVGSVYSILLKTPLYRSSSQLVLVSEQETVTTADLQLNKNLVSTYSEIVKSRKVVEQVIKNLSLDCSVGDLQGRITVTPKTNTEIMVISVDDEDKGLAADITNEIVIVFSNEIKNIYNIENVSIIDVAEENGSPYNMNVARDLLIYALIGVVLALAVIFVIYYFDTTIKSADEVEKKFDLPIFGVVPRVKRKEK